MGVVESVEAGVEDDVGAGVEVSFEEVVVEVEGAEAEDDAAAADFDFFFLCDLVDVVCSFVSPAVAFEEAEVEGVGFEAAAAAI